jgi:hypothetical protein
MTRPTTNCADTVQFGRFNDTSSIFCTVGCLQIYIAHDDRACLFVPSCVLGSRQSLLSNDGESARYARTGAYDGYCSSSKADLSSYTEARAAVRRACEYLFRHAPPVRRLARGIRPVFYCCVRAHVLDASMLYHGVFHRTDRNIALL